MLQDVKVFSEDGTSKVVEILADMTARDLCQLLVYRSHCVDDNSWALVEHHPHLGLGGEQLWVGALQEGGGSGWGAAGGCSGRCELQTATPGCQTVPAGSPASAASGLCVFLPLLCF